jgi:hypothetical protein
MYTIPSFSLINNNLLDLIAVFNEKKMNINELISDKQSKKKMFKWRLTEGPTLCRIFNNVFKDTIFISTCDFIDNNEYTDLMI